MLLLLVVVVVDCSWVAYVGIWGWMEGKKLTDYLGIRRQALFSLC